MIEKLEDIKNRFEDLGIAITNLKLVLDKNVSTKEIRYYAEKLNSHIPSLEKEYNLVVFSSVKNLTDKLKIKSK